MFEVELVQPNQISLLLWISKELFPWYIRYLVWLYQLKFKYFSFLHDHTKHFYTFNVSPYLFPSHILFTILSKTMTQTVQSAAFIIFCRRFLQSIRKISIKTKLYLYVIIFIVNTVRPAKMVWISWLWHYIHYLSISLYTLCIAPRAVVTFIQSVPIKKSLSDVNEF